MLKIRVFERYIAEEYKKQEMRCPMHLSIGQEAIAVGVCSSLKKNDLIYSSHRAHSHYIAKGGNLFKFIAELYGFEEGCSGGRGGSMHLIDLDVNFMGSTPIVGGTIPLATGSAWFDKIKSKKNVTVVFFGDGCFEEGVVHESLNFASLHSLPILFVCENNNFSVYTKLSERQSNMGISNIARAHGIDTRKLNGNDVINIAINTLDVVSKIRSKSKPFFLELDTYRVYEHCGPFIDDHLGYRSKTEIEKGLNSCPLKLMEMNKEAKDTILKNKNKWVSQYENKIEKIFSSVKKLKKPNYRVAKKNVF